jgi:hypothetical protein
MSYIWDAIAIGAAVGIVFALIGSGMVLLLR